MKFNEIDKDVWTSMMRRGDQSNGYLGTFITHNDQFSDDLLIFKDENDRKHFVVQIPNTGERPIRDPKINGLILSIKEFRFNGSDLRKFIDVECSIDDYLEEFTEIIKEIAGKLFTKSDSRVEIVNEVIENWRAFWGSSIRNILTEDEQIGLFCELVILRQFCLLNPRLAIESWEGPLKGTHDFVFSQWAFEIKGTRSKRHVHCINGIDQLTPPIDKSLCFISMMVKISNEENAVTIPIIIDAILSGPLKNKPYLIEKFYSLLMSVGYSPTHKKAYDLLYFGVVETLFFVVDENFPRIVVNDFKTPINNRISQIRYKIDLDGVTSENLQSVQIGNYFY